MRGTKDELDLIPHTKSLFSAQGQGLPIGNLTSQFFANVYLNQLDHFITEELGMKRYVRYVDDFVIIDNDERKLKACIGKIQDFLRKHLDLELHPRKIRLQHVSKGVDFLGYFLKPHVAYVRQSVVNRCKDKIYREKDSEKLATSLNSYYAHFDHAFSYRLKDSLDKKLNRGG